MVVADRGDPDRDLLSFLIDLVGYQRVYETLTRHDLLTAAYVIAVAERFDTDQFRVIDECRDRMLRRRRKDQW